MQVFSKEWFKRHQRKLLWFANTDRGKDLLRIGGDIPDGKRIVKVFPNCVTWLEEVTRKGDPVFTTCFYGNEKVGRRLFYGLHPLWSTLHWLDEVFIDRHVPELSFGFSTFGPVYPSAGTLSPCDGMIDGGNAIYTWNDLRSAASGAAVYVTQSNRFMGIDAYNTASYPLTYSNINRCIFMFDTSSMYTSKPVNNIVVTPFSISAATFSFYSANIQVINDFGWNTSLLGFALVSASPISTSNLALSDYSSLGSIRLASDAPFDNTNGWAAAGYVDMALNASGIANINNGITKFGGRLAADLDNNPGSLVSGAGPQSGYSAIYFADQAGTSYDPKLVVTYTAAVYRFVGADFFELF